MEEKPTEDRPDTKIGGIRHNWPKLKKEFISGEWPSVRAFLIAKKISQYNASKTKGWAQEKQTIAQKIYDVTKKRLIFNESSDLMKIRERQSRIAKFLQTKGMEVIKSASSESISADDARKMVVAGLEQERKSIGMDEARGNTSLTQININAKTNLDKLVEGLNYEGVLGLIAELKRERDRRFVPATTSESSGKAENGEVI